MPDIGAVAAQPIEFDFAQQSNLRVGDTESQSLPPLITLDRPSTQVSIEQGLQPVAGSGGQFMESVTASVGEFQQWPDIENLADGLTKLWQQDGMALGALGDFTDGQGGNPQPQWVIDGVKLNPPSLQPPSVEASVSHHRKLLSWIINTAEATRGVILKGADMSMWTARFSLITSIIGNMVKGIGTLFKSGG